MKKFLLRIVVVIGVLILLGGVSLFWFGYSFKKSLEPKIDQSLYSDIVKVRVEQSDRYTFLPESIPQDAAKVGFFHIPGFLQGGDVIALRISLPAERVVSVLNDLEDSRRTEIASFEGIASPDSYPEYGMNKPGSENMFKGVAELPEDFRIFLFKSDMEDIKKRWNHNILSFTAVSTKRNEVVYYINNW
jgi:hypothetical protein